MKKTKEELLESLKAYIGEDTSDASISLIEDVSDSMETDTEDWKSRYEENDRNWRKKYKERFYGKPVEEDDDFSEPDEPKKKLRFEDLFEEVKR